MFRISLKFIYSDEAIKFFKSSALLLTRVMRVGSDTFGDSIFQKGSQN